VYPHPPPSHAPRPCLPCSRTARCPGCIANVKGRSNYRGHRGYHTIGLIRYVAHEVFAMKRRTTTGGARDATSCPDPGFAGNYPTVAEYLIVEEYDDGKPRERSKLTVAMGSGAVGLTLTDPDSESSCQVTGETLEEALLLLEDALQSGKIRWRRWPWAKGTSKTSKQRT
jgi:hypothetical protein